MFETRRTRVDGRDDSHLQPADIARRKGNAELLGWLQAPTLLTVLANPAAGGRHAPPHAATAALGGGYIVQSIEQWQQQRGRLNQPNRARNLPFRLNAEAPEWVP